MLKSKKATTIAGLHEEFKSAELVVVSRQTALTVAESTALRRQVRAAGARFKVAKNRLAKRALIGTRFEGLAGLFKGPTAIAFSKDPVAAAKVVVEFSKKNDRVVVLGGALALQQLDPAGIKTLAALPSLNQLRGSIVGILAAPASKLMTILQAPGGQLARVTRARADKAEPTA